jgi:hypothetical protein
MIEIPILILITIPIASLGLGITIGFKVAEKKPEILESESFCQIAHFSQPKWPKIIFKNAKRIETNCSLFISKNKKCIKTNEKCKFFTDIDYDIKFANLIEKLKEDKKL